MRKFIIIICLLFCLPEFSQAKEAEATISDSTKIIVYYDEFKPTTGDFGIRIDSIKCDCPIMTLNQMIANEKSFYMMFLKTSIGFIAQQKEYTAKDDNSITLKHKSCWKITAAEGNTCELIPCETNNFIEKNFNLIKKDKKKFETKLTFDDKDIKDNDKYNCSGVNFNGKKTECLHAYLTMEDAMKLQGK